MKVDGSGIAIMSDSSIGLKPVIEEPSKPIPPSNASSSSDELIEKLFSWPSTSVNQRRMKRTSCSRTRAITSSAVAAGWAVGSLIAQRTLSARPSRPYSSVEEFDVAGAVMSERRARNRARSRYLLTQGK